MTTARARRLLLALALLVLAAPACGDKPAARSTGPRLEATPRQAARHRAHEHRHGPHPHGGGGHHHHPHPHPHLDGPAGHHHPY